MKKQISVATLLRMNGIKVTKGKIAKAHFKKAVKVLASDKTITKQNEVFEDVLGLSVEVDEIDFEFDYESDYGSDADGNRGRPAWFGSDITYKKPTHGTDEDGNLVPLTPEHLKELDDQIDKMSEDLDMSDDDYSGPDRREED